MSEPIRVLMVNYKMQCAGIESFIMNMYRNIDRDKVQFDFLVHYTAGQFYDKEIEQLGGKIYRLSVREDNNFVKYKRELKKFFLEHKEYKIVHGHMESFGCFYLKAAKKAGVPVRIAHSHIAQKNKGLKGFLKGLLNKSFKKYATDLFACSDAAGRFMYGPDEKYEVFNNAIDVQRFVYDEQKRIKYRQQLQIAQESFVVGHVGRFNTQKNHAFLIDIFSEILKKEFNATLLLLGEGDLEPEIKEKVKRLGMDENVKFLGIRGDMDGIYQAMDVFVMPSLFEGLPVSGVEAQAAGLKCFFADTVTEQTRMTEDVRFVSLKEPAEEWAKLILEAKKYTRKNTSEDIESAGYGIKKQAMRLQEFYLKVYE